jgi:hypothetical protein
MTDYLEAIVTTLIATLFGAISWLVRTVLTNRTEIELLKAEIATRDQRRQEDREILLQIRDDFKLEMKEVKDDVEELRSELLEVWKTK